MRLESIAAATSSASAPCALGEAAQEKLYTNADVSKMIKEAVSTAVSQTKEQYEKVLQDKLAGLFVLLTMLPVLLQLSIFLMIQSVSLCIVVFSINLTAFAFQSNINNLCDSTKTISVEP